MRLTLRITSRQIALFIALTLLFAGMGYAVSQSVGTVWHPLNYVATNAADKLSVDGDNDGVIDNADRAFSADAADAADCSAVTGATLPDFCANQLGSTTRSASAGQSCAIACTVIPGEICTNAWQADGTATSCEDTAGARSCTCLFRF